MSDYGNIKGLELADPRPKAGEIIKVEKVDVELWKYRFDAVSCRLTAERLFSIDAPHTLKANE